MLSSPPTRTEQKEEGEKERGKKEKKLTTRKTSTRVIDRVSVSPPSQHEALQNTDY